MMGCFFVHIVVSKRNPCLFHSPLAICYMEMIYTRSVQILVCLFVKFMSSLVTLLVQV